MDVPGVVDVLLVEDNPADAELTIRALGRRDLAGRLHTVEDGAEALDFLFGRGAYAPRGAGLPPKVILLDLKLSRIGGMEFLRTVKRDERTRTIPVVVVSSSREDRDIREAYDLGANGYVVKPVDYGSFMEALGTLGLYWLVVNQPPERREEP
ncbi:MAG TPA: response regulator [Candidatus Aminicenantes bacterium]|nr:response regulator [Candidatus Aminicenantes bacterium]HRY65417.1 response regulator [Candidatus Aminicenantes bacterium]HRZ72115.1 response regulator [Candidatus Aminicenantes bacterium]